MDLSKFGETLQEHLYQTGQLIERVSTFESTLRNLEEKIREELSVRSYSLNSAAEVSGLGYKKLKNACSSGELPFWKEGKMIFVRHTDLHRYIESKIKSPKH